MAYTAKAQHTRRHILETALQLFVTKGYDNTTMRDIASQADCSLGLAYRYFDTKQALVLALYDRMAEETATFIDELPDISIAERFHRVMTKRLEDSTPYRDALGALFSAALNPVSEAGLLGDKAAATRQMTLDAFSRLVTGASDAPGKQQSDHLATLLYTLHFALILFWLHDRKPHQQTTAELLEFTRTMLKQLRFIIRLPYMTAALKHLSTIMAEVFLPASEQAT